MDHAYEGPLPPGLRLLAPDSAPQPFGFFGGAFNPPTLSHAWIAEKALAFVKTLLVVPSFCHPFKGSLAGLSFEDRVGLLRETLERLGPRVEVSEVEKAMGGTGYTLDVLRTLQAGRTLGAAPVVFVGEDLLAELPRWHGYESLAQNYVFKVMPDTGLHATQVRERLKKGEDISDLAPPQVVAFLRSHPNFNW